MDEPTHRWLSRLRTPGRRHLLHPRRELIRAFGLGDFLVNDLKDEEDAATIAVKALAYFCEDQGPQNEVFKFAVLTVGLFLNHYHARRKAGLPQQALRDLVSLLTTEGKESQIRAWIDSHFG